MFFRGLLNRDPWVLVFAFVLKSQYWHSEFQTEIFATVTFARYKLCDVIMNSYCTKTNRDSILGEMAIVLYCYFTFTWPNLINSNMAIDWPAIWHIFIWGTADSPSYCWHPHTHCYLVSVIIGHWVNEWFMSWCWNDHILKTQHTVLMNVPLNNVLQTKLERINWMAFTHCGLAICIQCVNMRKRYSVMLMMVSMMYWCLVKHW